VPKLDKLIQRRFQELVQKAQSVQETYHSPVPDNRGNISFYHMDSALFEEWATSAMGLLERIFTKDSVYYQNFQHHHGKTNGGHYFSSYFEDCLGVFRAAKEDYDGGYLFNVITLAKADTMTDLLAEAEILKNANQVDFACIAAGIALELAVREVCKCENCTIGKFSSMNEALWKKGVYNQAMWEQLKSWYTRRSEPAHGKLGQSTPKDADDMIKGVRRFIAGYL
jgi:hypothetical protein